MRSPRLPRRAVLLGAAAALAAPAIRARAQVPPIHKVRATRLTRGLMAARWFESLPSDPAAIRAHVENAYQAEDFAGIRTLGFNHLRIALDPRFLAPRLAQGDAALDRDRLKLFDDALGRITRSGLAIVLANFMSADDQKRCAEDQSFRAVLGQWLENLAGHMAGNVQHHVDGTFLELFNEPGEAFHDVAVYRRTLEAFVAAARRGAPDHTLIVGGNRWNSIEGVTQGLGTPLADRNLIYGFHFYQPLEFTQQGVEAAGPLYARLRNVPWDVDAGALSDQEISGFDPEVQRTLRDYNQKSHRRADLQGAFAEMRRWCDEHGQIGWLGEFGVHNAAVHAQHRVAWTHHVRELAEEHKFGWSMAEARGPFGLFLPGDARPLRPDRPLLAALGL